MYYYLPQLYSKLHYDIHQTGIQLFEGAHSAKQFLAIHCRCIKRVLPDGNCLFWALSQQLNGFEELHQTLRELLVKFISCNLDSFRCSVTSGTIESRLESMQRNAQWGTQVEIQAAASLFQVPIYVATNSLVQGVYKWTVFKPQDKSSLMGPDNIHTLLPSLTIKPRLELCHISNTHYDSIIPMKGESLPPPPLDGTEYSVDLTSDATAD